MKTPVVGYTFVKGGSGVGTVTFTGSVIPTTLERILAVVNVTRGIIIYNPSLPATVGTYSSPTLTLTFDTSAQNNADKLLIYTDDGIIGDVVRGDVADNAAQVNLSPVYVGAKAVTTASYAPAYTAGDSAGVATDKDNGGVLVNQANLKLNEDTVGAILGATATNQNALSRFRSLTQGSTGAMVKSSTGNLYQINIINSIATIIYVKIYDKATAATNSDAPVLTIPVAGSIGVGVTLFLELPVNFVSGISIRCVTGILDNDASSPSTSPIIEIGYL